MKNVLAWIKANLVTVVSAVLMLVSIGVIGWAVSYGGGAAKEASAEVTKMARDLDSHTNVTVPFPPEDVDAPPEDISGITITKATLKHLDEVYGKMNREYDKTYKPFVQINQQGHYLLVPGVLPTTDASHLRHEARTAYRDAFVRMFEPYDENMPGAPRLNASGPLSPDELQFELQRVAEGYRPSTYKASAGGGGLSEADRKAIEGQKAERAEEMLLDQARSIHLYADTNILSSGFPFQVGGWSMATGLPTFKQIWDGHMELWVQQDIVRAIGLANEVDKADRSVIDSPVKRLISIDVIPGYVGLDTLGGMGVKGSIKTSSTGSGTAQYGGGGQVSVGYGGGGAQVGGPQGAPAAVAGSPDDALSVDYNAGPSGRTSNVIYDVKHARMVAIVDYQQLPKLFDAISEVNFMSVLDCQITDVDEYDALLEGYVYGSGDAVQVDMLIETIWLREWTRPWMPDVVKEHLGIGDPAGDVAPEEPNY
jgi:hypothetical protein